MHVRTLGAGDVGLPSGRGTVQNPIVLPTVGVVADDGKRTLMLIAIALLVLWALSEK